MKKGRIPLKVEERLVKILKILEESTEPIIARELAETFDVSRQVIVGDIARLRAAGENILSTPRGYLLNIRLNHQVTKKIICRHSPKETVDEINTIVELGGKLLDVTIDHPVYGELTGALNIFDQADADQFNQKVMSGEASLLSELTEGIHVHTIAAETMALLEVIEEKLKNKGYLA